MSIQLSVSIWTVICFVIFMLILKFLLFDPVLAVMDKRRERIENAKGRRAQREKIELENQRKLIEFEKEQRILRKKAVREQIEKIQIESKKAAEEKSSKRVLEVEEYREKMERQSEEIISSLSPTLNDLAATFAERMITE